MTRPMGESWASMFAWPADADGDAFEDLNQTVSYADARSIIAEGSSHLQRLGLGSGTRVAVEVDMSVRAILDILSVIRAGAVLVPIDSAWTSNRQATVLSDVRPHAILKKGELLVADRAAEISDGELRAILYTSGTSGIPKGVMLTATNMSFALQAIASELVYTKNDRVLSPIHLAFDYGLYQIFLCFSAGCLLRLEAVERSYGWLPDAVARSRASIVIATPSLVRMGLAKVPDESANNGVRMITLAGEAVDKGLLERLRSLFPAAFVRPMYGITECKRISIAGPSEALNDVTSVGRPLAGTEVTVRDERGERIADGAQGELYVRGPHVAEGYWGCPEETAFRFPMIDGKKYLRTEDIGYLDVNGRIHVTGRAGNGYKERGVRTSTDEVEYHTRKISGVWEAVALAPSGDSPSVLLFTGSDTLTVGSVAKSLADTLGVERIPRKIHKVENLPVTENGKLARKLLRTEFDGSARFEY